MEAGAPARPRDVDLAEGSLVSVAPETKTGIREENPRIVVEGSMEATRRMTQGRKKSQEKV